MYTYKTSLKADREDWGWGGGGGGMGGLDGIGLDWIGLDWTD